MIDPLSAPHTAPAGKHCYDVGRRALFCSDGHGGWSEVPAERWPVEFRGDVVRELDLPDRQDRA